MASAITYQQIIGRPMTIRVYLDKKRVGTIYENIAGSGLWQYFPLGAREGGERYATLAQVKASLESA